MAKNKVLTAILQLKDRNFGAGLRQGSSGLDKFRRGIYRAGDGVDKFGKNTISGFNRVGKASSSLTKTIVGLGSALLGLKAIDWAKDQAMGGLEAASSLESYRLTLDTVMKDTKKAGEVMQWASKFSAVTPFEDAEVIEGTVRLQSYGIEAQKTMGSIGDMASVMNKDLMQAIEAVADAQTGELERMKEFGITKSMIQDKADKMFKGKEIINKKGQITDQEKFNKAMFALMDERFKGGMEKQSKTFKGLTSTITGTWKTGLAEMVGVTSDGTIRQGSLFEKLKKKADEVSKRFQTWSKDGTFTRLGEKLSSMVNKFEEKLPAIKQFFVDLKTPMQVVGDILKKIGQGFQGIIDFVNKHPDIARNIGLTAAGAVIAKKTGLLTLGKGVYDAVKKTTVGTQTIKAGVVNVFGAKVNGTGGIPTPDGAGKGKGKGKGQKGKGGTGTDGTGTDGTDDGKGKGKDNNARRKGKNGIPTTGKPTGGVPTGGTGIPVPTDTTGKGKDVGGKLFGWASIATALATFGKTVGKAGKTVGKFGVEAGKVTAKEALSSRGLMMVAATDVYSGTTEKSQELGANFVYEDLKKNGFNVIDPALNDKNINLPPSKQGYSTARYGASPEGLQATIRYNAFSEKFVKGMQSQYNKFVDLHSTLKEFAKTKETTKTKDITPKTVVATARPKEVAIKPKETSTNPNNSITTKLIESMQSQFKKFVDGQNLLKEVAKPKEVVKPAEFVKTKETITNPADINVHFNMGGVTIREEADIDKLASHTVSMLVSKLKTMGMVTTSVTSFSGYSQGRR